jgi:hypothetical protein
MNRGWWLLGLGVSSLAAAFAAPGCSSSDVALPGAPDGGGTNDATSSGSGGGDTGLQETGSDAPSSNDSAPLPDGPSMGCAFPGFAPIMACVNASCCTPWSTCLGDPACRTIATCALNCSGISPGDAGDWITNQPCFAQCTADGGATAVSEFNAGNQCIQQLCTPGDGGGGGDGAGDTGGGDGGSGG